MAPATMKQNPMTGTTRTEKAPPATTAVPYMRSHNPESTSYMPRLYSWMVSSAPTIIGGEKLRRNFLPAPDMSGSLAARAFRTIAAMLMTGAMTAAASQVLSQATSVGCCAAMPAATSAVIPTTTIPQPDTAVNAPARSIVSRMKARLSIARTCSDGSSRDSIFRSGLTEDIQLVYGVGAL